VLSSTSVFELLEFLAARFLHVLDWRHVLSVHIWIGPRHQLRRGRHSRFGICFIVLDEACLSDATLPPACCSRIAASEGERVWPPTQPAADPRGPCIRAVQVLSGTRTVAVGDGDVVVRTDDAGGTWQAVYPPYGMQLQSVFFVDAQTGWAVGAPATVGSGSALDSTTVLRTEDGGASWRRQVSATLWWTTARRTHIGACCGSELARPIGRMSSCCRDGACMTDGVPGRHQNPAHTRQLSRNPPRTHALRSVGVCSSAGRACAIVAAAQCIPNPTERSSGPAHASSLQREGVCGVGCAQWR
jgi:hypothetical protein